MNGIRAVAKQTGVCLTTSAAILLLLGLSAMAAPSAAMKAACASDRQRLCNTFVGKPSEMQNCMIAHRAEWSVGCAGAAGSRRAKCAAYVQNKFLPQNSGNMTDRRSGGPAAIKRCMLGGGANGLVGPLRTWGTDHDCEEGAQPLSAAPLTEILPS